MNSFTTATDPMAFVNSYVALKTLILCTYFKNFALRFFLISYLTYKFGEKIGPTLDKVGTKWSLLIAGAVIVIIIAVYYFLK